MQTQVTKKNRTETDYKTLKKKFYKPKNLIKIHQEEKRSNLATRVSGRKFNKDRHLLEDPLVGNITKDLNPHSLLVRPVKLHAKIPKGAQPVRIPDAS